MRLTRILALLALLLTTSPQERSRGVAAATLQPSTSAACPPVFVQTPLQVNGTLTQIAASSAQNIWAVGFVPSGQPLAVHWDGHTWQRMPTPDVGALLGVAVLGRGDVWVAGGARVAHWHNHTWQRVPVLLPMGAVITGMTALANNDIWLVGYQGAALGGATPHPDFHTLTEHWDGTRWNIVPSADPSANVIVDYAPLNKLYAVTAVAANDVWAVGEAATGQDTRLIEHWDGKRWRVVPNAPLHPSEHPNATALTAVAAHAPDDVWAVGLRHFTVDQHEPPTEVDHWDGHSWHTVPTDPRTTNSFSTIIPFARDDAWGIGDVVEHWDGSRWQLVQDDSQRYAAGAVVSPNTLWVVGSQPHSIGDTVLIARHAGVLCLVQAPRLVATGVGRDPYALLVDDATHRVFVADGLNGSVHMLDAESGAALATLTMPGALDGGAITPVNGSDRLVLDKYAGHVFSVSNLSTARGVQSSIAMIDAASGALLRTIPVSDTVVSAAVDESVSRIIVISERPDVSETTSQGTIWVIDSHSGATLRSEAIGTVEGISETNPLGQVPIVVAPGANRVFVSRGSTRGVLVLDATTGAILSTLDAGTKVASPGNSSVPLAIDEHSGHLFVVESGAISVFDLRRGTRTGSLRAPPFTSIAAVDQAHGNLVLRSPSPDGDGGSFSVLNSTSGTPVLSSIKFHTYPSLVALDTQRNRLIAAGSLRIDHYGQPYGYGAVDVYNPTTGALLQHVLTDSDPLAIALDELGGRGFVAISGTIGMFDLT